MKSGPNFMVSELVYLLTILHYEYFSKTNKIWKQLALKMIAVYCFGEGKKRGVQHKYKGKQNLYFSIAFGIK